MTQNPLASPAFYATAYFIADGNRLRLVHYSDPQGREIQTIAPRAFELSLVEMEGYLKGGPVKISLKRTATLPPPLIAYTGRLGFATAAYVPVMQEGQLRGLVLIGARAGQTMDDHVIEAVSRTIRLTTNALLQGESTGRPTRNERRTIEVEALNVLASAAATVSDLHTFYRTVHEQIRSVVGDHGFVIALYDQKTNSISIPYLYEDDVLSTMDTFPLGEGLTSILIRSREPLMLVEETEKRATAMGAKIAGKPAKSWLGVPLLARGEAVGAVILQDLDNEHSFDDDDLRFVTAVAGQIASTIYNIRLLNESQRTALEFETAAEIARDISSSLELDELLLKAVNLIRSRFDYYHASVFLKDLPGESVIVREATGEAGVQLKRMGHKVAVGSRSPVGNVAGEGEMLVVNDTSRDSLYTPNPLMPETRAEAVLPLKVGERIVGVLDVHSKRAYAFSNENLRILQILADQLAIAVVNTELFAETQEHLAQHRLLHHITTTAASGTTLGEALQSAVNGLQVTLGGDRVSILLADRDRRMLEVKAAVGYAEDVFALQIPLGTGVTGWVASNRRPLRVNDVSQDARYIEGSPNTRSELAIPLLYRSELLGVLNVESEQLSAYAENDEELLGTLGGSLAAIIANARLLEQIRAQAERERLLFEISDKIRRTTDMQTILATTASELTRALGASNARIRLGTRSGADGEGTSENELRG